ncbi:CobW family GTP-binding protein [Rubinisphaera sp. JC750]|uniref:CobW family GTP-binding protein n=1 Tax=Rubinisphaera sp. JC750 TaxID=2898658 RepID=UPI001F28877A|nr:GTP-binding protein [Rubinisphaera sp. JC750]
MSRNSEKRIPTNVIVGFLGSGKTTAIARLCEQRPAGENWSVLINEFGVVSIDHALVDSGEEEIAVEELGGGCACCTLSLVFQPLLRQFIERTNPARLIIEPSGVSHPANVVDILRSPEFADLIDLRNIICLVDPKDAEDHRWRQSAVFQDQLQLADIVVLNWTDNRDRDLIDRCRTWVESFRPPKQLILETSFGEIDSALLDRQFALDRFPLFADAHPAPGHSHTQLQELNLVPQSDQSIADRAEPQKADQLAQRSPTPGRPLRFQNNEPNFDACGWIFHVDDIFDRDELLDLLGYVHPIVRLKGVFRCEDDWWTINRAKEGTSYAPSAYRRDSRLEIIIDNKTSGWKEFEAKLVDCLVR